MIDPGIWVSEQVSNLSRDARLLFIGLISNADDEGRLKGSPRYLKATVFPYDNIEPNQVATWLREVTTEKLALEYNVNGDQYIFLPNFLKHQYISRPRPSQLPPPDFSEPSVSPHGALSEGSHLKEGRGGEKKRNNSALKSGPHKSQGTKEKDPRIAEIFKEMRAYLGFPDKVKQDPIPAYGREGQAIKRMLTRGFTREAIVECWKSKVSQRGGEFISMTWVNQDIGNTVKQTRGARRPSTDEEIATSIKEATTWHGKK